MRALFIWEAPPPPPPPLTPREVFLLVDVDMGVWSGIGPDCVFGREIAAALAHRDALEEAKRAPFVSLPDIPVEGYRDGLVWAWVDVDPNAWVWKTLMTSNPFSCPLAPPLMSPLASFGRRRFLGTDERVFVRDGLDVERVAKMLGSVLARAA